MPEIKKIHCNNCKCLTNHELKSSHSKDYHEVGDIGDGSEHVVFYENIQYNFYVCLGCDTASLEEKYHCLGMYDSKGDDVYSYSYFPERRNVYQREPKKFLHIDSKLKSTYIEVIKACNLGLEIVCAMGIRALLEGICLKENIDDKKAWALKDKIKNLKEISNIPDSIIEALNSLKIIGDDAAHRLMPTDKHSMDLSIDVLEALLTHLYEAKFDLEHKANLVRKAHNKNKQLVPGGTS